MTKRTLRQRLVITTVTLVLVISSLFASGLFLLKQRLEEVTFGKMVQQHLDVLINENLESDDLNNRWFSEWQYYRGTSVDQLPAAIRALSEGSHHSVDIDDQHFQVHVADVNGEKVFLLYNISEWEKQEHALLVSLCLGFVLVAIAALISASKVADSILEPVKRLTARLNKVQPHERGLQVATEFADSDIEQIARAFDTYLTRIDQFVEREQSFTAAASHELRTPLSVMLGAVDVIEASQPSESGCRALQRIRRASGEMQAFIEATLLLSREENNTNPDSLVASVTTAIERVIDDFRSDINARGIELTLDYDGDETLPVPESILKICIVNLVRNAIEHTQDGLIKVCFSKGEFSVKDSGEGIARDDLPRIFDRAFSTKPEGTGLGLNLVKRICDRFGWSLVVDSEEGKGTIARIQFAQRS